jgi:pimeloyl-ACP methyl ester carboxylesterase
MLPQLQSTCVGDLMNSPSWNAIPPASLFQPNAQVDRLLHDFARNEPLNLPIHVPLLLEQGTDDRIVSPVTTEALRSNLCGNGVQAELDTLQGANHGSIMPQSFDRVKNWVARRFAGTNEDLRKCTT